MVTGASTAHLAIILIDARKGVLTQSRRHGYIASLLGIPHLVVAVNKMDLVDWKQEIFDEIVADYTDFCDNLNIDDITFYSHIRPHRRQRGRPQYQHALVRRPFGAASPGKP
jgi:sulfate adenylyltransferase subunit 1 (EFTu-like GTPase family)